MHQTVFLQHGPINIIAVSPCTIICPTFIQAHARIEISIRVRPKRMRPLMRYKKIAIMPLGFIGIAFQGDQILFAIHILRGFRVLIIPIRTKG